MKIKTEFVMRYIGGDYVLLPSGAQVMKLNGIITLNETAAYLWQLLAKEHSLEELATALAGRFHVADEVAFKDIRTFVDEMSRLGVVQP